MNRCVRNKIRVPLSLLAAMMMLGISAVGGEQQASATNAASPGALPAVGFVWTTPNYEAKLDAAGNLISLRAGGVEFLSRPAGFVHAGQWLPLRAITKKEGNTVIACGDPKDPAKAVANAPCPYTARVTYVFKTGVPGADAGAEPGYVWRLCLAALRFRPRIRNELTDTPISPAGPFLYGQTNPRLITNEGPILRFDFGVWQKGFANASWSNLTVDGKPIPCLQSTVAAASPIKAVVYPLAHPGPGEALTFDISARARIFCWRVGSRCNSKSKRPMPGPHRSRPASALRCAII